MPAQPPQMPSFEKEKYATGPWGALFAKFWELLQPFLKTTADTLRTGVPVQALLDIPVQAGQTFPMSGLANPLPEGYVPAGLSVVHVFDPAAQGRPVLATSTASVSGGGGGTVTLPAAGVFVEWKQAPDGSLVVLAITGLPSGKRVTVRVLVLAE